MDSDGNSIERVGVAPDVAIEITAGAFADRADIELSAAPARLPKITGGKRAPSHW